MKKITSLIKTHKHTFIIAVATMALLGLYVATVLPDLPAKVL